MSRLLRGACAITQFQMHRTARNDGGDGVLVDHLSHGVAQQEHVLIERFNLSLQFDPIDQIHRHRNMFTAQGIEKRILEL